MSDLIRLLPDSVANQIAAGEVVQRPSSVVKELLENSLDAGATTIDLIFKDGGQTLIQVVDNGKGMSETDARMCWERHATSKIKQAQDLFNLSTFGFRGEALASIASVAQVEMKTKPEDDSFGTRVVIEAGVVREQEPVSMQTGTSISVKNLFYNIPVRRNFLKSISVETRYIIEEFERCALARPDVRMSLMNGDKDVHRLAPADLHRRIEEVTTKNRSGQLLPVEEETELMTISGFVGSPERARKTRGDQYFYVNGRFIKDAYFHHAVLQAFDGLIDSDVHPLYVLKIDVDPSRIDVNVHPTKTEVKFEEGRAMYAIIKSAVLRALGSYHASPVIESVPGMFDRHEVAMPIHRDIKPPTTDFNPSYNPFSSDPVRKRQQTAWEKLYEPFRDDAPEVSIAPQKELVHKPHQEVRIGSCFQLELSYIVAEVNGTLHIVHQKRAHERVLYEQYNHQFNQTSQASQQLLFPRTLDLSAQDYDLLMSITDELERLGFDISPFGKNAIIVNGTPADIKKGEERDMIEGIIESFRSNERSAKLEKRDNLARSLAFNAAVRLNTSLSPMEMNSLIQDLFQCDQPAFTPSGKAVFVTFGREQLNDFFKR
ncbi:MAG: DNA mismatch repair endonuclease MutL [Flavobacteriales bacterium]|nr:DNA mismatch repair endonuclease MutL [Bacteroidota bacterium]MCB9241279.1 DNA mismatch repair endonuclease MutL [Flavobacteriales bacterium]